MYAYKYYDGVSSGYDELHGEEQRQKLLIINKELNFSKHHKILDVGGGTGISVEILNSKVVILEPSSKMIDQGLLKRRFDYVNDFAENIAEIFEENEFDAIISLTSAHHFHDLNKVMLGIKKALKDESDLVITMLKKSDKLDLIKKEFEKNFLLKKEMVEEKDVILFFKNKK